MVCDQCEKENPPRFNYCYSCAAPLYSKAFLPRREEEAEAERRQLTVMFCDLVGSTALSEKLDPEELRDVVQKYQEVCGKEIEELDGYIAQYLGDGILVYFGYPTAYEDGPHRAIAAALKIIEGIKSLASKFIIKTNIDIAVRIGIHTGLAVIGDIGLGSKRERLALGETPNIAARMQGLAEPNGIIVSADTHRLTAKQFDFESRGEFTVKGISQPIEVYEPTQEHGHSLDLLESADDKRKPFVGRARELELIQSHWSNVSTGQADVLLVKGSAGFGKTRLVREFISNVDGDHERMVTLCSYYHNKNAYYPLLRILNRAIDNEDGDTALDRLESLLNRNKLDLGQTIPIIAALVDIDLEDRYEQPSLSARLIKQHSFEILATLISNASLRNPAVFIVEDLQWADPTTLEFLEFLISNHTKVPLLYLFTYRPSFENPWKNRKYTEIQCKALDKDHTTQLSRELLDKKGLPAELENVLLQKTNGVPLFVEEWIGMIRDVGVIKEQNGTYVLDGSLPEQMIPSSLKDLLTAKLDQLGPAKEIAQIGAVFGREFSVDVIESISGLDFEVVSSRLLMLIDADLLTLQGQAPYFVMSFKHALMQEEAYELLLKKKRQEYHQRIAEVMESRFADFCNSNPDFLAFHFGRAGNFEKSVQYWQKAGVKSIEKSAQVEAIHFFKKGLSMLKEFMPGAKRDEYELQLMMGLAPALLATKGYTHPEVEEAYDRAHHLTDIIDDMPQISTIYRGMWAHHLVKANHKKAEKIAKKLRKISAKSEDVLLHYESAKAMGGTHFWIGDFNKSADALADAISAFDPEVHYKHIYLFSEHPCVSCHTYASLTSWMLGQASEATRILDIGLAYANKLNHPFSIAYANAIGSLVYQFNGNTDQATRHADTSFEISQKYGYAFWMLIAGVIRAWAQLEINRSSENLEKYKSAIEVLSGSGARIWLGSQWTTLADYYLQMSRIEEGFDTINKAKSLFEDTAEGFHLPEVFRVEGLLELANGNQDEGQSLLKESWKIANGRGSSYLEIRALADLVKHTTDGEWPKLLTTRLQDMEHENNADIGRAKSILEA